MKIITICPSLVLAATIAQLIASNENLSYVARDASKYPQWSEPGTMTVFAPTNQAIDNFDSLNLVRGHSGVLTSNSFIAPETRNAIVKDFRGQAQLVYKNRVSKENSKEIIEIRTALGTGQVLKFQIADNGILFVTDQPIGPRPVISKALVSLDCSEFASMVAKSGLTTFFDGLVNVTIFAPTNDAFQAIYESFLKDLSPSQIRAYVLYHVVPQVLYTNNIRSRNYSTLLGNEHYLPILSAANGIKLQGSKMGALNLADNFVKNGVIHRIDFFLHPHELPGHNQKVEPENVPSGSRTFNPSMAKVIITEHGRAQATRTPPHLGRNSFNEPSHDILIGGLAALSGVLAVAF